MPQNLRVLLVEDSEDDALLMLRELRRYGYSVICDRIDTAQAMIRALDSNGYDIILSDFALPHFSGEEALKIFSQYNLDIPLIIVSGKIGEEKAVALMKAGAYDYVPKTALSRLVPAVERALDEAGARRMRRQADEERENLIYAYSARLKELGALE